MVVGFEQRFWPMVQDGSKTHTVRGRRKKPIKVGRTMHLYGRVRQPGMFLLQNPAPLCAAVDTIVIYMNAILLGKGRIESDREWNRLTRAAGEKPVFRPNVLEGRVFGGVALHELDVGEREAFAFRDGFRGLPYYSFRDMINFWITKHGTDCFPFCGEVLHWK